MNSRKLVHFFFTTLIIGGIAGLITSFFVKAEEYSLILSPFDFMELLGLVVFFIGIGFVFSMISQTGFFAYLFINRFGLSIFRSYWSTIQIVLVAFVVFDLIYFPYKATQGTVSIFWYILMSFAILAYGWFISEVKAQETNRSAFAPALFLMVVMTTLEWIPGLQTEGTDYAWLMIIPLLACNTYQLLALHRLTKKDSAKGKQPEAKQPARKKKAGMNRA
ncbi:KinB signaling pathway activation protein [Virgibacillus halotolerans]|uniref:KinB-signaling pathway activation protein n=1 Tax=Virgibacillus halotolerans TaxID=1071053 RepID=UPI00195FB93E|nr:KinB-signaling pathway activation protein [Virgibacillus halotolerans]MBM7601839.1 KinB signaling pathway activation protein [Virgibacillus halotolerans]